MKFIKLHSYNNKFEYYINVAQIQLFTQDGPITNMYVDGDQTPLLIKESAEEIMKMIANICRNI